MPRTPAKKSTADDAAAVSAASASTKKRSTTTTKKANSAPAREPEPAVDESDKASADEDEDETPHYDVVIIGAGLSGIAAAYHLKNKCPNKKIVILESRSRIGGTWDLFKYPGIRSDSSMETMGYTFKPWMGKRSISDGKDILEYIHETVDEHGLRPLIKCGHSVASVNWDSEENKWYLDVKVTPTNASTNGAAASANGGTNGAVAGSEPSSRRGRYGLRETPTKTRGKTSDSKYGEVVNDSSLASSAVAAALNRYRIEEITCNFVLFCTGYYDYEGGYMPAFKGRDRYEGTLVHPQKWPTDLDYSGKKVVIIGSGATAVTLLPVLARTAAHVTMLQRSPTYIVSVPAVDPAVGFIRSILPHSLANVVVRWYSILVAIFFYWLCQSCPGLVRKIIRAGVQSVVKKDSAYMDEHFNPRYDPWDQRLCVVPDADFFEAIRDDRASVVTDKITTFTKRGIALEKAAEPLEADIIISATGLKLKLCGGIKVFIDDKEVNFSVQRMYKGVCVSNIPNAAISIGYTNSTWTLKCDLTCEYFCKLINYMDATGLRRFVPVLNDEDAAKDSSKPVFNLSSGYIQRTAHQMPRQGSRAPWVYHNNYLWDILALRYYGIQDDVMQFE